MRLLIYTAAIAVLLLAFGWRITVMQDEINAAHAEVSDLRAFVNFDQRKQYRMLRELQCVHFVFEDGSAMHPDAEVAHRCLQTQLGWP
jgi:hypothetical protein